MKRYPLLDGANDIINVDSLVKEKSFAIFNQLLTEDEELIWLLLVLDQIFTTEHCHMGFIRGDIHTDDFIWFPCLLLK